MGLYPSVVRPAGGLKHDKYGQNEEDCISKFDGACLRNDA